MLQCFWSKSNEFNKLAEDKEGKSSTAYFFRLEKKRATDCYISALRASDGSSELICESHVVLGSIVVHIVPLHQLSKGKQI